MRPLASDRYERWIGLRSEIRAKNNCRARLRLTTSNHAPLREHCRAQSHCHEPWVIVWTAHSPPGSPCGDGVTSPTVEYRINLAIICVLDWLCRDRVARSMSPTGSGTSQYHLSAGAVRLPSPGKMSKTESQSIWQQRRRRWAPWWRNWVWAGISPGHRTALGQATFVSAFPLGCSNGVDGEIKHSILPNRWAIHDRAEAAVTNVRSRPVRGNLSTKSTVQRSGTMKSEFELTQMIMAELRKHLECTEVDRVLLLRPGFRGQRRQLGHSRRQERSAYQPTIPGCRGRNRSRPSRAVRRKRLTAR